MFVASTTTSRHVQPVAALGRRCACGIVTLDWTPAVGSGPPGRPNDGRSAVRPSARGRPSQGPIPSVISGNGEGERPQPVHRPTLASRTHGSGSVTPRPGRTLSECARRSFAPLLVLRALRAVGLLHLDVIRAPRRARPVPPQARLARVRGPAPGPRRPRVAVRSGRPDPDRLPADPAAAPACGRPRRLAGVPRKRLDDEIRRQAADRAAPREAGPGRKSTRSRRRRDRAGSRSSSATTPTETRTAGQTS